MESRYPPFHTVGPCPYSTKVSPPVNYGEPLSSLLRIATARAHADVENSSGVTALISGKLPLREYLRYQFMLWHVYESVNLPQVPPLSRKLTPPPRSMLFNLKKLLARSEALSSDIGSLLDTSSDPAVWQTHPSYQAFLPIPIATANYVTRIQEIASSSDPTPLLAHSYVRYLGDLSGGQFIKRIVSKVYELDDSSLSFYDFGKLGASSASNATSIGDMKEIKDWFRAGIDAGVATDLTAKEEVIREANVAFELNSGLFSALNVPTSKSVEAPTTIALQGLASSSSVVHVAPTKVITSPYFVVPKFVTLLLAMYAAHFLLAVCGLTGASGGEKLQQLFQVVRGYYQSGSKALGW